MKPVLVDPDTLATVVGAAAANPIEAFNQCLTKVRNQTLFDPSSWTTQTVASCASALKAAVNSQPRAPGDPRE